MDYEYKCVGAPERPRRSRRAKTPSDRLARAMELIIQDEAVNGWEYMRTDLVPVIEKSSFLGRTQEVHRAVLVFRREIGARRGRAGDDRSRRDEGAADLFGEATKRRRPPPRRRPVTDDVPDPLEPVPASPESPEPVDPVPERPRRTRAVPAEEPIRLSADDMVEAPRGRPGRDRSPPSGLG